MSMMTTNYSIYMIPAYYVLAVLPHVLAIRTIRSAYNEPWDNEPPVVSMDRQAEEERASASVRKVRAMQGSAQEFD